MELSADELKTFLFEHGDLHDCRITNVTWSLKINRLEVSVADLNANFLGLPEYAGPQPGRLIFDGIRLIRVDAAPASDRIYETSLSVEKDSQTIEVLFSPAGKLVMHAVAVNVVISVDEPQRSLDAIG
ncbi:hypothetical protein [Xanthomonas oryzae]|uniref:hypothetical protein n=1 Tax=Xanthomonas oryzae TaxID=347 RepID=UPI00117E3B81|nr:hypothetical protein [Xanthomonas oryzae]